MSVSSCCPTCGRTMTARKLKPAAGPVDTATLSTADLYAHYKRTAPYADLAFWINTGTNPRPVADALAHLLLTCFDVNNELTIQRAEFYRRFTAIQALWRKLTNEAARTATDAEEKAA